MYKAIDMYMKKKNHWVQIIHNQVYEQNSNWLQMTVGPTGSGKSSFNLSEAIALDPTFTVCPERVAFNVPDFIRNCVRFDEKKNGRGKVVIMEEVGVGGSGAKNWNGTSAKKLSEVLQTFRSQGLICLMSVPDDELFIKDGRRLLKGQFIAKGIDWKNKVVRVKPLSVQHNSQNHKTYYHYARIVTERGLITVNEWALPLAPKEIWDQYEAMMEDFKRRVRTEAIEELEKKDKPKGRQAICRACDHVFNLRGDLPTVCGACGNRKGIKKWSRDAPIELIAHD